MFNEVMYHPADDASELEWVELFNAMSYDMDISGWELDGGIEFTFPNGTIIPADGYLVVAKSPAALEAASGISNVFGPFDGKLSNGGEEIRLENNSGRDMDVLSYGDGGSWPVAPDGSGVSLAKIKPVSFSDNAGNWHAGPMGGTPSAENFPSGEAEPEVVRTTLIAANAVWKYRDLGTDPGTDWMNPSYTDSSWSTGAAKLGYGENDEATVVSYGGDPDNKHPTTYFRHVFQVDDLSSVSSVDLSALIDDGAVFYLNGVEFARIRMAGGAVDYLDFSSSSIANATTYEPLSLSKTLLQEGDNLLAVEVHQIHERSSDLALAVQLFAEEVIAPPPAEDVEDLLARPKLAINEIEGVTNEVWWVELVNLSDTALDPSGYRLSAAGDVARQHTLSGPAIPAGGFRLLPASELGFAVLDEEPIFLYRPDTNSVSDARVAKRGLRGRHGAEWLRPSTATPGTANQFSLTDDIVINEIMYHHQATNDGVTFAESDVEWVELFNRGAIPIDIGGWKFDDGIDYEFPIGSSLAPGGYLVISNFSGSLSDSGERLRLVDAVGNPADEVRYFDGGRWPEYADGGGSSLELRDPFADNTVAEAWAGSDETSSSNWKTYTYEMVASSSAVGPDGQWHELVLGLHDNGEVLLDDISVIEDPYGAAIELISTPDFEGGAGDWRIIGNHRQSAVVTDPDDAGNKALKLVASGSTEHMHNHAEITLANGRTIQNGKTYRVTYRAKWLRGCRLLNTRLYFNRVAKTTVLDVPMSNGTPGAQNSTYVANAGPTFVGMRHDPVVPLAGESVTISVGADDVQGVQNVLTWYSVDGGNWQSAAMTLGSNDLYRATLPGQASASVVQFYVEAEDSLGATATFPARGADARALYKVDDGLGDVALHNFRIIMTAADADFLDTDIQLMSNEQLGCTVIFDDRDIYYDVGARYKGSERGRVVDSRIGFRLNFHADQPLNGVHQSIAIDRSANQNVSAREMLINVAMNRGGGVLSKYTDLIKVIAPKVEHTSPAELYLSRYNDVFLDAQFENGGDGGVFELEYIYYPTTANAEGYKLPKPDSVKTSSIKDHGDEKENYRWNYMIKNKRAKDDFSPWIRFAKIMGSSGASFNEQIGDVVDVDQWLRYMAYAVASGHGDNYSSGNGHNAFFYSRPSDGRMLYFPHDMDLGFQTTRALVANNDLNKMIGTPERERLYFAHMWDILQNVYNVGYMQFWTDQLGVLIPTENFASHLNFIGQRHNFLVGELQARVAPQYPFAVTDAPETVAGLVATVSGDGWLDVAEVRVDGVDEPLELVWTATGGGTSRTYQWSADVPLEPGLNALTFLVYDFQGNLIDTRIIEITSTASGDPLKDHLRVTELMHSPRDGSDYEFIELFNSGTAALDLSGVYFSEGIEFDFSAAGFTSLAPQTYCVIVKDLAAFSARYDTAGLLVAGEYSGKLSEGETVELRGALSEELRKFTYQSNRGWPVAADGAGHSLVALEATDAALYHGANWRASADIDGSPGRAESPRLSPLALNEIVAHTDYSNPSKPEYDSNDQIELYNSSTNSLVLDGNWYLSDDADQLDKWNIPASTVVPAKGHVRFEEVTDFHAPITSGFGLDKAGEQVYLSYLPFSGDRYVADAIRFKGQENGVSLGRYEDGSSEWYALTPTPNANNEKPTSRPVISELMYHPLSGVTNNTSDEYIEIHNPTDSAVALWNEAGTWRIAGGVDFVFPTNTTLEAGENALLVSFDPADSAARAAFLDAYGMSEGEAILMGPFSSSLDNRGERVALERPQAGDLPGEPVSWVIVDEVIYFHQIPWPTGADGTGNSLQRKYTRWDGNNPGNWYVGQSATPGENVPMYGAENVPEFWFAEVNPAWTTNLAVIVEQDPDLDGLSTGEEYVAGTNPLDGLSVPQVEIHASSGSLMIGFDTLKTTYTYNGLERYYELVGSLDLVTQPFTNGFGFSKVIGNDVREEMLLDTSENSVSYRLNIELDE